MNSRNIQYIKRFNSKKQIHLANNKIKTKKFLWERGIPVAKMFGVINSHKELLNFDFGKLPNKDFVVKPNKGSKGKGIYIIRRLDNIEEDKIQGLIQSSYKSISKKIMDKYRSIQGYKDYPYYYKSGAEILSDIQLKRRLIDNIEGKNSMTMGRDKILIEEKILPSESFKKFCKYGLADIRIIVFNLVPIAAMIRIPTSISGGKANLAIGGIGLGIDIASGKIMVSNKGLLKQEFSEEYEDILNHKISFWDDILLYSTKTQYFVNLGYLALDWVITEDGPSLLEMNARAGLEIQNIVKIKLKNILKKISGLDIKTPEKGVEICKSLFSQNSSSITRNKILFLSQEGVLKIKDADNIDGLNIRVNLNKSHSCVSKKIYDKIKDISENSISLGLPNNDIILRNIKLDLDESLHSKDIIIGTDISNKYLIKPIHQKQKKINIIREGTLISEDEEVLYQIDDTIHNIGKKLILSSILKPVNYLDELDKFLEYKGKYNPVFEYRWPKEDILDTLEKDLLDNKDILCSDKIQSPIKKLRDEKIDELLYRLWLIKSYKEQNFDDILKYNIKLFGNFDKRLLDESRKLSFEDSATNREILGDIISANQVKHKVEEYIAIKGFDGVEVVISPNSLARMAVSKGKIPRIKILAGVEIREKELDSILAHEIDTHLTRYVNGQRTGWHIFANGTGFYLKDEEGLAIKNGKSKLPKDYVSNTIYKNYFLLSEAQKYSFSKIFDLAKFLFTSRETERIFGICLRVKKGIIDTSTVNKGAIFMKEKVYLDGFDKVKNIDISESSYNGKFKFSDLDFIK